MDREPDQGGASRRGRWVSQIVAISAGEREKGYAATTIFAAEPGARIAHACTLPDEFRRLEAFGFDLPGFLVDARSADS